MASLELRRVERLTPQQLQELSDYDREAFGPTGLRTYDLAYMVHAGAVYLALIDEEVVGSCQLLRTFSEPDMMWIVGFYVRPQWQGRGFGKDLLWAIIDELPRWEARGLVLTVAPWNTSALNLYLEAGFEITEEIPEFYGAGEDRYLMRLEIGGAAALEK